MLCTLTFVHNQIKSQRSTQNILRDQQLSHHIFLILSIKLVQNFNEKLGLRNAIIKQFLTVDKDQSTQHIVITECMPPPCFFGEHDLSIFTIIVSVTV